MDEEDADADPICSSESGQHGVAYQESPQSASLSAFINRKPPQQYRWYGVRGAMAERARKLLPRDGDGGEGVVAENRVGVRVRCDVAPGQVPDMVCQRTIAKIPVE